MPKERSRLKHCLPEVKVADFRYLDQLRESGETNMWGAAEYLERTFSELTCDHKRSSEILFSWMRYTENRHAEMEDAE